MTERWTDYICTARYYVNKKEADTFEDKEEIDNFIKYKLSGRLGELIAERYIPEVTYERLPEHEWKSPERFVDSMLVFDVRKKYELRVAVLPVDMYRDLLRIKYMYEELRNG